MAESRNDRAKRRRLAVAELVAAKKQIDASVALREGAKSKISKELEAAASGLRAAEERLKAATAAALSSGALTPDDGLVVADGYAVSANTGRGGKVSVSVRKVEKDLTPKRPGRGKKAKATDGEDNQQERDDAGSGPGGGSSAGSPAKERGVPPGRAPAGGAGDQVPGE